MNWFQKDGDGRVYNIKLDHSLKVGAAVHQYSGGGNSISDMRAIC